MSEPLVTPELDAAVVLVLESLSWFVADETTCVDLTEYLGEDFAGGKLMALREVCARMHSDVLDRRLGGL